MKNVKTTIDPDLLRTIKKTIEKSEIYENYGQFIQRAVIDFFITETRKLQILNRHFDKIYESNVKYEEIEFNDKKHDVSKKQ